MNPKNRDISRPAKQVRYLASQYIGDIPTKESQLYLSLQHLNIVTFAANIYIAKTILQYIKETISTFLINMPYFFRKLFLFAIIQQYQHTFQEDENNGILGFRIK